MIADLCTRHNVLCISDETYEWLTYDDATHFRISEPTWGLMHLNICGVQSKSLTCACDVEAAPTLSQHCLAVDVFLTLCHFAAVNADNCVDMLTAKLPGMWERTVTIGSGGKSFSATGLKVTHDDWLLASFFCPGFTNILFVLFLIWGWVGHWLWEHHLLKAQHQLSVFDSSTAAQGTTQHPKCTVRETKPFFLFSCPWRLLQEAVAQGFEREYKLFGTPESYFRQLPAFLLKKRETGWRLVWGLLVLSLLCQR